MSTFLNSNLAKFDGLTKFQFDEIFIGLFIAPDYSFRNESMIDSQRFAEASDGILQSPRGDRHTEPTFGPSGRQDRLNC